MPIQIIDNFDLTSAKPLDNRVVVGPSSFYINKDLISHKYPGLRIWDLNDSIPYVWTGATWSNENSSGAVTSQNGTASYISKFVGLGSTIANSVIYEDGNGRIGINTLSPSEKLEVNGDVKATLFKGLAWSGGFGLQNINLGINGGNVTGTIGLNNIPAGSNTSVLQMFAGSPTWVLPSSITAGASTNATNATNTNIINDSSTNTQFRYITFVDGTSGNRAQTVSSGRLQFNPFKGQLLLYASSTAANPAISFISDDNTGIYRTSAGYIAFSTGGLDRFIIADAFVTSTRPINLPDGLVTAPCIRFLNSSGGTGIYSPAPDHFGIAIGGYKRFIARTGSSSDFEFYSPNGSTLASLIVDSTSGFVLSLNAITKIRVSSGGVQMMKQTGIDIITPTFTLSGTSGTSVITNVGQSGSAYTHAYTEFDRYITVQMGSSGSGSLGRIYCAVEEAFGSGVYYVVERRNGVDAFTSTSFLVPAYCRFLLEVDFNGAFSTQCSVKSRRFGVN